MFAENGVHLLVIAIEFGAIQLNYSLHTMINYKLVFNFLICGFIAVLFFVK